MNWLARLALDRPGAVLVGTGLVTLVFAAGLPRLELRTDGGLAGAAASVGWFTAMTLQIAAYVRTLGQVELIFAMGSSLFFFRERLRAGELAGIAAILAGLVLLIALG